MKGRLVLESFFKSILRQPVFAALLLISPMLGLLLRPVPELLTYYLPAFDFHRWQIPILATAAGFPSYLYGLLAALLLLDDRDRGVLPALMVTPVSRPGLLMARVLPAAVLAALGTPLMLVLSGWNDVPGIPVLAASALLAGPSAAFYALVVGAYAGSKVQGITLGKVLGTVLPVPLLGAVLSPPWTFFTLAFPSSWMYLILGGSGLPGFLGGCLYTGILLAAAWKIALIRYFRI